jgi:hypothetical protein
MPGAKPGQILRRMNLMIDFVWFISLPATFAALIAHIQIRQQIWMAN